MEEEVEQIEQLTDTRSQELERERKRKRPKGYINTIVQRASHRTFRFIRWLRNHLNNQASYTHAIARLNILYTHQI